MGQAQRAFMSQDARSLFLCIVFSILSSTLGRIFMIYNDTSNTQIRAPFDGKVIIYVYPEFQTIGKSSLMTEGKVLCQLDEGARTQRRSCDAGDGAGIELSRGDRKPYKENVMTNALHHVAIHIKKMNCALIGKYQLTIQDTQQPQSTRDYKLLFALRPGVLEKQVDVRPTSLKLTCFLNVGTDKSHLMSWSMHEKSGIKRALKGQSTLKGNKKQPCIEVLESTIVLGSESDTNAKVVCRYQDDEEQQQRTFNLMRHAQVSDESEQSFLGIPKNDKNFTVYAVTLIVSLCVSVLALIWVCLYCWLRQRQIYSVSDCETCTASTCDQCESDCSDENCDYMLPDGATLQGILCHKHRYQEAMRGTEYTVPESVSSEDFNKARLMEVPKGKKDNKYLRAVLKAREQVTKSMRRGGKQVKPRRRKRKRKKRKRDKKRRRKLRTHAKTAHRRAKHWAKKRQKTKAKKSKSRKTLAKTVTRPSPAWSKPSQSRSGTSKRKTDSSRGTAQTRSGASKRKTDSSRGTGLTQSGTAKRKTDSSRGTGQRSISTKSPLEVSRSTEPTTRPSLSIPEHAMERVRQTLLMKERERQRIVEQAKQQASKEALPRASPAGRIRGSSVEFEWNRPVGGPHY